MWLTAFKMCLNAFRNVFNAFKSLSHATSHAYKCGCNCVYKLLKSVYMLQPQERILYKKTHRNCFWLVWTKLGVSRCFQLAIYTVFDVESDAVWDCRILQGNKINWIWYSEKNNVLILSSGYIVPLRGGGGWWGDACAPGRLERGSRLKCRHTLRPALPWYEGRLRPVDFRRPIVPPPTPTPQKKEQSNLMKI